MYITKKLNYLPLKLLNKQTQTKWYELKIYMLLPIIVKYFCIKFDSCPIKTICVILSQRKFGETDRWMDNVLTLGLPAFS